MVFAIFSITDAIEILQQAQIDAKYFYIEKGESENNSAKITKFKVYSNDKDEGK